MKKQTPNSAPIAEKNKNERAIAKLYKRIKSLNILTANPLRYH